MAPEVKSLFKDEFAEIVRQTQLEDLKSAIVSFGVTPQRALQGISINEKDRPWFEEQLGIAKA